MSNFREILKKETGIDLEIANAKARGLVSRGREAADRFRLEMVPDFVQWNKWDNWKVFIYSFDTLLDEWLI